MNVCLVHAVLDALAPALERLAKLGEVWLDVVDDAEVDQRQPGGCAALDLDDRALPGLEVELGRRARAA